MKKLFLFFILFIFSSVFSQTVTGIASNTGCKNSGIVTATTTGITSPVYQLQSSTGTVIAPVAGDINAFTASNVFGALSNGTYKIVAQNGGFSGGLFSSANIAVNDGGYTNMALTASPVFLACIGSSRAIIASVTGGKSPYIYSISDTSTSVVLQTSTPTSALSFSFNPLPLGTYTVSVQDNCGVTTIVNTAVNSPIITVSQVAAVGIIMPVRNAATCATTKIEANITNGFKNTTSNLSLSGSEQALFTYKLKYLGSLYGTDINADGHSDIGGAGYPMIRTTVPYPVGVTRDDVRNNISTTKIVITDQCGNTKELSMVISNGSIGATTDCVNGTRVQSFVRELMVCFPITFVFTNTTNPADVLTFSQTINAQFFSGFTAGKTYTFTHTDANGATTNYFGFNTITTPVATGTLSTSVSIASTGNLNVLGYGTSPNIVVGGAVGDSFTYEVTASNNVLVPVGTTGTAISGSYFPNVNGSDPSGFWPKGNYSIKVSNSCGVGNITLPIAGFTASVTGNTITPVCGGFDYVMKGSFDVPLAYEVVITAGPSNLGLIKDILTTTASDVFSSLTYGSYTAKLRIKGGTTFVGTQDFTFGTNSANPISVDKDNTGGFVCTAGATNGSLTIVASSISPVPNNVLQYRLSTDGGVTFGSWQSSNVFTGLTNTTYYFQVKDGCGFIIADTSAVSAVSSPNVYGNPSVICELDTSTVMSLVVDANNAMYQWTGPGINATNATVRNPTLNIADLNLGVNTYSVIVTTSFCGSTGTTSTTITKLSSTKAKALSGVEKDSKVGISTQGSDKWLATTKNGALVLESSNKGFVITRMKTSELPSGSNAIQGMLAYDTDVNCLKMYDGTIWKCIARVCP